jgi:hypothetical protein
MSKPGRNEPCPCGSGKKYKNCCLNKDHTRRVRDSAWRREEQVTLDKLLDFGQRPEFRAQLAVASNLFWNGNYGMEGLNALPRDEAGRFLDWYWCDYRLEETRKRIIDLFLEESGPQVPAGERERLAHWQDSHLSLYRIAEPPDEGLLNVTDVLQETKATARDDGLGRLGLPGDLLLGRLLFSSEPAHLSWAAILLPAAMETGLSSFMRQAYAQHQTTHLQATWAEFLSDFGYLFNHYLLRAAAEAGAVRLARGAYYDASETMAKLAEVEKALRERKAKEATKRLQEEQRRTKEEPEPLRQTRGGILLPGHVQYKGSKEQKP